MSHGVIAKILKSLVNFAVILTGVAARPFEG